MLTLLAATLPFVCWAKESAALVLLLILHIYWFYLIMRMVYRFVIVGVVEKDERSATLLRTLARRLVELARLMG